jgi:hypothetical protein
VMAASVIECLNGYRLKEKSHQLWWIQDPIGVVESSCSWYYFSFYGSTLRLIEQAAQEPVVFSTSVRLWQYFHSISIMILQKFTKQVD